MKKILLLCIALVGCAPSMGNDQIIEAVTACREANLGTWTTYSVLDASVVMVQCRPETGHWGQR